MNDTVTTKIRKPKDVKQKSNRRYKDKLNQSQYELNNDSILTSNKSTSLNKSIDNIFLEKSFDASIFNVRSPSKSSIYEQQESSPKLRRPSSNSIYDIYSTIVNSSVVSNKMSDNYESKNDSRMLVMKDIFRMDNRSVDLEMYSDCIRWKDISTTARQSKIYNSQCYFKKIFAVEPKITNTSLKSPVSHSNQDQSTIIDTDGFIIHLFVKQKPNNYITKTITFQHPHRITCNNWIQKLSEATTVFTKLKRELLIIMNPHSGQKRARSVFNHQIHPLLHLANFGYTLIEFHDSQPLRDIYINNNLHNKKFYGIIILGGDGSVSAVINTLIEVESSKEENLYIKEPSQLSKKMRIPFCVIPIGSTNLIANSIYGTTNLVTPLMFLFYGIKLKVDVCSAFTNLDKLHSFGFMYSCGVGSTMARYLNRYEKLGSNKVLTSISKATSKHKHKLIELEIDYLFNEEYQQSENQEPCFKNCKTCSYNYQTNSEEINSSSQRKNKHQNNFDDIVSTIHDLRASSTTRSDRKNSGKSPSSTKKNRPIWIKLQGSYIYVAVLVNSSKWSHIAPAGLSKYAHLGDGFIDIILVDPCSKKDFYRFLKRHGNSKNQLDFPFVKTLRVREATIRILNSNNEIDLSDTESLYFNTRPESRATAGYEHDDEDTQYPEQDTYDLLNLSRRGSRIPESEITMIENFSVQQCDSDTNVDGFEDDADDYQNYLKIFGSKKKSGSISMNKLSLDEDKANILVKDSKPGSKFTLSQNIKHNIKQKESFFEKRSKSIMNLFKTTEGIKKPRNQNPDLDTFNSQSTIGLNIENNIGNKSFILKEKKSFASEKSMKMANVWNCDWNMNIITEMHLKCNRQFLTFFAEGVDPETQYESSSYSCLPRL